MTLLDAITLEQTGADSFAAPGSGGGWGGLFGGRLVAQALAAANATVAADRPVHSLHAYFLSAGAFDTPLAFAVHRERDGRGFSARRVVASQGDRAILTLTASFQVDEEGPARDEAPMPDAPPPESLAPAKEARGVFQPGSFEDSPLAMVDARPIDGCQPFAPERGPPHGRMWVRVPGSEGADRGQARALLAFTTDLFLLNTALQPYIGAISRKAVVTSLDHAVWFHADPTPGEWMLYVQESGFAAGGRSMCGGAIYAQDGRRLATVAQEALTRLGLEEAR